MAWAPLVQPRAPTENLTARMLGTTGFVPTLGQSLGTAAAEAWAGGTGAAADLLEYRHAMGLGLHLAEDDPSQRQVVTEEDWKASSDYRPTVSWFEGMTADAAKVLAQRHDVQARRDDIFARSTGVGRNSLMIATGLATGFADPLGIASSFIPVVGEARMARLVAQLGRTGARVTRGAVEGAVGQALLEPMIFAAKNQDQLDYSMLDSLTNVGQGALFGAGLHAGLPVVGAGVRAGVNAIDVVFRGPRGARQAVAAADVAITQAAMGADINVTRVLHAGERQAPALGALDEIAAMRGREENRIRSGAVDPTQVEPNLKVHSWLQEHAAEVPDVQAHGIVGAEPERQLADLLVAGIDPERPFHTGSLREATDPTIRAAGLGAKVEAPYIALARPGEDIATHGVAAVLVNDSARGAIPRLQEQFPDVKFLTTDDLPAWAAAPRGEGVAPSGRAAATQALENAAGDRDVARARLEGALQALQTTVDRAGGELPPAYAARIAEHQQALRLLDEGYELPASRVRELALAEPDPPDWRPLTEADDFGDTIDDPEALWLEELERAPVEPERPAVEGQPKPLTPQQQIELDAQRYQNGVAAAVDCIVRALG